MINGWESRHIWLRWHLPGEWAQTRRYGGAKHALIFAIRWK